jgi:hypothetical protein
MSVVMRPGRWRERRLRRLADRMWREGRMQPATEHPRDQDDGLGGVREPRRPRPDLPTLAAEEAIE